MRLTPYDEFLKLCYRVNELESGVWNHMMDFKDLDKEVVEMGEAVKVLLKMAQELKAALENQETTDASKLAQIAETLDGYQKEIEEFTSPQPDNGGSTGKVLD